MEPWLRKCQRLARRFGFVGRRLGQRHRLARWLGISPPIDAFIFRKEG